MFVVVFTNPCQIRVKSVVKGAGTLNETWKAAPIGVDLLLCLCQKHGSLQVLGSWTNKCAYLSRESVFTGHDAGPTEYAVRKSECG